MARGGWGGSTPWILIVVIGLLVLAAAVVYLLVSGLESARSPDLRIDLAPPDAPTPPRLPDPPLPTPK